MNSFQNLKKKRLDTGSDASSADNSHQRALTGLIVAVSILAALLALLLLAGFAYWFFKLR